MSIWRDMTDRGESDEAAVARLTAELLARREVDHWLGPANAEQRHWRTLQHLADGTLRAEDHDAGLCVEAPDYPALVVKLRAGAP